jgi:two-component system chemotaxis response regulator CheY
MKKKILAIDDNSSICLVVQFTLDKDFEVVTTSSALDAIKILQDGFMPDVIITDLQMPDLSGLDFIINIRLSSVFKKTPILVLSGKEDSSTRIESLQKGANDFLMKPFNPAELKVRIENLILIKSFAA